MTQEITVTKTEDHYEMQFDGGNAYPVPTNAIETLDDDLTPTDVGDAVTFRGDYGGHKHCKSFDVEEVLDGVDDEDESDGETEAEAAPQRRAEPTEEHIDDVGYNAAAGQAQQTEAQRLFTEDGKDGESNKNELVTDGGREMSRQDVELVYRYARDRFRADIESEAFDAALGQWEGSRPDDLVRLEDVHSDDVSAFRWEDIDFETSAEYDGDLVPITGVSSDEPETRDLAREFAWDYLDSIRGQVRHVVSRTDYSPRQFVALVLDAAENTPEDLAHREMEISLGNYRGKKGDVRDKLSTAKDTVDITKRVRA